MCRPCPWRQLAAAPPHEQKASDSQQRKAPAHTVEIICRPRPRPGQVRSRSGQVYIASCTVDTTNERCSTHHVLSRRIQEIEGTRAVAVAVVGGVVAVPSGDGVLSVVDAVTVNG